MIEKINERSFYRHPFTVKNNDLRVLTAEIIRYRENNQTD